MTRFGFLRALAPVVALVAVSASAHAETESGDPQLAFNNSCRTCHSMRAGDHRLGPSLHGVVGRKAGSVEGYNFSSAMQSSNIVWDEATLDKFITNPDQVVRGHKMKPFGGIDFAEQRGEIIAFLKSISDK